MIYRKYSPANVPEAITSGGRSRRSRAPQAVTSASNFGGTITVNPFALLLGAVILYKIVR